MNKEWIFWALLVIVIVVVSLYIRLYSTQTIAMSIALANPQAASTIYPYQNVVLPITVTNTGSSAITSLVFSVLANGNQQQAYQLTIPVGKSVSIQYNFTPVSAGRYNITVIADPAGVYNVQNRNGAQNTTTVVIANYSNPQAYTLLPKGNVTSYNQVYLGRGGFLASSFLYSSYNISMFSSTSPQDRIILSVLNLTQTYIRNVSSARATYANGASSYSVWIRGYLKPSVIGTAAIGAGYHVTNYTIAGNTVTFVRISNSTSLCSWYESGWIKSVAYSNSSASCLGIYNKSILTLNSSLVIANATIYNRMTNRTVLNTTLIGNFSGISGGVTSYGEISVAGSTFVVPKITLNGTSSAKCFGIVSSANGTTYCSVYLIPSSGALGGFALIKTMAQIGTVNASVFSLVNSSSVYAAIPFAIASIKTLNLSGARGNFSSGFTSSCAFSGSFTCSNPIFLNGTIKLNVTSTLNQSARINGLGCYETGSGFKTTVNETIAPHSTSTIGATCYSLGRPIVGVPLKLTLKLLLNYTSGGITSAAAGNATINILSS
ncbi:MAG TPA: CARDB domain-containing protein [Candidatus Aquilonibacter sp.]|nr:CARDB domain-containing protein [Candidatus Aquilonibacter sp.]